MFHERSILSRIGYEIISTLRAPSAPSITQRNERRRFCILQRAIWMMCTEERRDVYSRLVFSLKEGSIHALAQSRAFAEEDIASIVSFADGK